MNLNELPFKPAHPVYQRIDEVYAAIDLEGNFHHIVIEGLAATLPFRPIELFNDGRYISLVPLFLVIRMPSSSIILPSNIIEL